MFFILAAEYSKQRGYGEFPFAVNAHIQGAVGVAINFNPRAAGRNNFRSEMLLASCLLRSEEHAKTSRELRHNDALNAGNNERAVPRHERKIRHKNLLLFHGTHDFILEPHRYFERGFVRELVFLCVEFVVFWLRELEVGKAEFKFLP